MNISESELENRIDSLLAEERKTVPSPFLTNRIEEALYHKKKQVEPQTYLLTLQHIVAGLFILFCAALGFLSIGDSNIEQREPPNIEPFYFNEMKIETPEGILLE